MLRIVISGLCAIFMCASANASKMEVLHWWTSGGEAKSLAVLKKMLEEKGHNWQDFAVAGGGGENAMTVLKSRVLAGNPPFAAQLKGTTLMEWSSMGVLSDLSPLAKENKWKGSLSPTVAGAVTSKNKVVAIPVNIHRANWMWVNPKAFKKAGAKIPTTWEEFANAAAKLQKAGIVPVAHGGQNWQDATLFEALVLSMAGGDFYRKAFIELDPKTLGGATMKKVLERFAQIKTWIDPNAAGRDWNIATSMVIKGEAAMQIMGDWAKGEFLAAGKKPGDDFLCLPLPGSSKHFAYVIDSFAVFAGCDDKAVKDLATSILDPKFQTVFNQNKGSIPARTDVSLDGFDACAKDSRKAFASSELSGGLVPSMAHGMATGSAAQGVLVDTITSFFHAKKKNVDKTLKELSRVAISAH